MNRRFAIAILIVTIVCAFTVSAEISAPAVTDSEPITNITFVAFDTETTGLGSNTGRVIEIGAVKFKNRQVIERKSWLVNPEMPIPENTIAIHGITDTIVENSPKFADIFGEFRSFTEGAVLLAHNAAFDTRFISSELKRCNITPPPNTILDSLKLARNWFPNLKSYSIESLLAHWKIERKQEHRGLSDAECVMEIFILGVYSNNNHQTLGDLKKCAGGEMFFRK